MISAVARIMQPGVKADHMLILEGPQGGEEVDRARRCSPATDWFTDELAEIGSKDAAQQMRGVWIIEIAELDAIGRAEVSRIKAFLTRTVDRYRPPYDRYVVDVPRSACSPAASTPTPICATRPATAASGRSAAAGIDLDALAPRSRPAVGGGGRAYRAGAIWWIDDPDLIALRQRRAGRPLSGRRLGRPDRAVARCRAEAGQSRLRRLRRLARRGRSPSGYPHRRVGRRDPSTGDRDRAWTMGPGPIKCASQPISSARNGSATAPGTPARANTAIGGRPPDGSGASVPTSP